MGVINIRSRREERVEIHQHWGTQESQRSALFFVEIRRSGYVGGWVFAPREGLDSYSAELLRIHSLDPAARAYNSEYYFAPVRPEDREFVASLIEGMRFELFLFDSTKRMVWPDGVIRYLGCEGSPLNGSAGARTIGIEIGVTERELLARQLRDRETELRRSETELRVVIDAIPTIAWSALPDGSNIYVNKGFVEYSGLSVKQSAGSGWQAATHPEDLPHHLSKWMTCVATGEPFENEVRFRRSDGQYRWHLCRGVPLRDDEARIVKWYGILLDIDELKKTESALHEREQELLGIIETIPSMLWSVSPTGRTTYLSQRVLEYCGVASEELIDRGWEKFIHPDDREETARAFDQAISSGNSYSAIHRLRRADGIYRWHHSKGEPLRDSQGQIIQWYGLATDIDEPKRAEDHLRDMRIKLARASQIATVAELSASIAHELNQPLMSVLANAQAAKRWLAADPPNLLETNASIERIIRDARAADEVMQHIRGLFKQESFEKKLVNIREVLLEAVRFLKGDPRKHGVSIDWRLDGDLPRVAVDVTQVQQVFINLLSNAWDAVEGQSAPQIIVRGFTTDNDQLVIQVIDNGPGVPDQEGIFDAFVTTKMNGMGIGLAVSRSIIVAHGGRLWAENNQGDGATFNVAFPLRAEE
jgi:PAS domain S-box-containing protein